MYRDFDLDVKRFNMSPPPDPGDDKYEERLTNWFLEGAFFRDFVYRDQKGKAKKGELADGLVLFDKTALFVQSKAQVGKKGGTSWAKKHIGKALDQVCYGERMLRERHVAEVVSETLGPVSFDPERYTERTGLIVVRQESKMPFVAADLVPKLGMQKFPIHVLSLGDLIEVATRFDTAEDFLWYLEERGLLAAEGVLLQVHREIDMARVMLDLLPQRMRLRRPNIAEDVLEKSVEVVRRKVSGEMRQSEDWTRSLVVDDIIARMHDRDPSLQWNVGGQSADVMKVAELLSALDRHRRAEIGKRLLKAVEVATDGSLRAFWHAVRWRRCCYVFLVWDRPREERLALLIKLMAAGMARSGQEMQTEIGVGVATNSRAVKGRAYDVAARLQPLTQEERVLYLGAPDPFGI